LWYTAFLSNTLNTTIEGILASCFMDDRYGRAARQQTGKKKAITCGKAGEATRGIALPRAVMTIAYSKWFVLLPSATILYITRLLFLQASLFPSTSHIFTQLCRGCTDRTKLSA
jgi:hypothetical protein